MKRAATARIHALCCGGSTWRNCSKSLRTERTVLLVGGCLAGADFLPATRSLVGLQNFLAQPDGLRCDFHELVVGDEFDGLLETQFTVRNQADGFVRAG